MGRRLATRADLLAIPEEDRFHEVIDGELIRMASASGEHGVAKAKLAGAVGPYHRRVGSAGGPGGWWLVSGCEIELDPTQIYRPDLAGWRRERVPERPTGFPVTIRPDWVCEVLSPSNRNTDTVRKFRNYQRFGVPHYWIVDPSAETLTIHRWMPDGYLVALSASADETVRPEPFDAIELYVGTLFGKEPP